MKNDFATIQIKNNSFKLTIGYLDDNKVSVLYKKEYPLTSSIKDGDIFDLGSLSEDLRKIKRIQDDSVSLKIELNEIVLILEPYGLEVLQSEKTTSTISTDAKIQKTDIKNVINMVKKSQIQNSNNQIVDIVPSLFSVDGEQVYTEPPLGVTSNSLLIKAHVYTLPKNYVQSFKKAIFDAGLGIKKVVISPLGVESLFEKEGLKLPKYVLVDYNSDNTVVSFFANNGKLFGSRYFSLGSNEITKDIANNFQISMDNAEKLKLIYGLSTDEYEFNPPIVEVKGEDDISRKFNKTDLNEVISLSLNEWNKLFSNCLDTLLNEYSDLKGTIPFVFIGNGCLLNGFKDFINYYYPSNQSIIYKYHAIGADSPSDANALGAISFVSTYKGSLEDDSRVEVTQINREEDEINQEDNDLL